MLLLRTGVLGLLASAALLVVPAQAQDAANRAADSGNEDIVVTGRAEEPTHAEVSRQAREITETRGDLMYNPLARIEDRLCPGILGLKPEFAALMIDRIRWTGERLDMWMADDTDCSPNLIIAFVEDGQAELQRLAENNGYMFQWMDRHDRDALLAEEGPVRVWTTSMMRASNGMPLSRRENLTSPPVLQMNAAHSKIYINVREDIAQTVVLFDREKVREKTLIQLADYATMRGFAKTKPASSATAMDTILALFDENGSPPSGLTDFDQAYLRSLYDGIPNLKGMTKINGVDRELRNLREEQAEGGK
ncbi:hypothetical protein [Altererythrobacter sp. Root672]|uniref:hypothetical protein n=1 Tax=Altererythrobacter sp. Root672 TaxID=1736584 RepID=UPI0006FFBDDB|nr:hypothetical protein [Altererythrobacter sp. Root672]KRA80783.1 hypothetical protein ASD76_16760 [Altererythrobacter sp. Root672]